MTTLGVADSKAAIDSGTIRGAAIDNCVIGATTAVAGSFTTLAASSGLTGAVNGTVGATTPAAGSFTTLGASGAATLAGVTCTTLSATGNVALGDSTSDTIGMYGVTPIAQRSGAAQATSLVGTASSTAIDSNTKAAIIEIMNALVAIGAWKGSA